MSEERRSRVATADLYDEHEEELTTCELPFRDFGGAPAFHGEVETVRCFEDNALLRRTLSGEGAGRVLVVDGGGSLGAALLGDMIGELATGNGWSGVVIHGAVRDVAELRKLELGIKALASNPRRSARDGAGKTGVTVSFGGVDFAPGGWVYADEDGVVYGPRRLY